MTISNIQLEQIRHEVKSLREALAREVKARARAERLIKASRRVVQSRESVEEYMANEREAKLLALMRTD